MGNSATVLHGRVSVEGGNSDESVVILSDHFFETYRDHLSYFGYKEFLEIEHKKYEEYLLKMQQVKGVNTWCGV